MKTPLWVSSGLLIVGASFLFSCGGDERLVAGKPAGSETSEELAARELDSDGNPVAGASVRLRPTGFVASDSPSTAFADLVSDSTGKVVFPSAPAGDWWMEIRGDRKGLLMPFPSRFVAGGEPPSFVLRPFGGIRGKVDLPWGCRSALVRLVGVDRVDTTDTAGNFHLQDLSPSDSSITLRVTRQDDESMIAETLVQVKPLETLELGKTRTPTILLSDFEQGMQLGLPWPDARWYLDVKAALLDGKADTLAKGHEGNAIRVAFLGGYPGVAFLHADLHGPRNLLGLDSMELWVKGRGGVSVYLSTTIPAWKPLMLDSMSVNDTGSWKRFVVKPWAPSAWRVTFGDKFSEAAALSIKFESSGFGENISLDDVRLYGVSPRDWH